MSFFAMLMLRFRELLIIDYMNLAGGSPVMEALDGVVRVEKEGVKELRMNPALK